jgi:hypothetical protein
MLTDTSHFSTNNIASVIPNTAQDINAINPYGLSPHSPSSLGADLSNSVALNVIANNPATLQPASVVVNSLPSGSRSSTASLSTNGQAVTGLTATKDSLTNPQLAASVPQLAPIVNFSQKSFTGYSNQDTSKAVYQITDNGSTLQLAGQAWKKIDFAYNVTANTVLEFDFRSDAIGNTQVIGFDNDNSYWNVNINNPTGFKLYGYDQWIGWSQTLNNYKGTDWRTYSVKIGANYTGAINYLFFANTPMTSNPSENSLFRNVRVYDTNTSDTVAPTVTSLNAPAITTSSKDYLFKVTYADNTFMNPGSLDSKDIRVTGANGFNQLAQFVSATSSSDRTTVEATYKITSNVGWGINDKNGVYTIALEGNQVSDYNYTFMAAQTLGTFNINVPASSIVADTTLATPININPYLLSGYSNQDNPTSGKFQVTDSGSTLQLSGQTWKKLDFAYNVTANTVLSFDFRSDVMGVDHAIGFDNDNSYWNVNFNNPTGFLLYGSDTWPGWSQQLKNYSGTDWKSYSINIGKNYTGAIQYLFFANSPKTTNPLENSFFRNIRVYDINSLDTAAPTTTLSFPNATTSGGNTLNANNEYVFTVTYNDAWGIALTTVDSNDINVLSSNGNSQKATLVSATASSDRKTVTATYKILDNIGWSANQANQYTIQAQSNQVGDLNYNFITLQNIGNFTVQYTNTTTQQLLKSQSEFNFNVNYYSPIALNVNSLDNQDLLVTGPNGFQGFANFVSVQQNGSNQWVATYKITDSDGIWDAKNNGNYTINLQANQVSDISGAALSSGPMGNLVINTQETAMWFSGFENGFPGNEWLNYSNGTLVANGQPDYNYSSNWSILNQTQASQDGVAPLSGNSVYKGWINYQSADSHRPYPVLHVDPSSTYFPDTTFNSYLNGTPVPVVNRFYAWADWDPSSITSSDWLSFLTLGNNVNWNVVTMSLTGPQGKLEMAHAPFTDVLSTPTYMPQHQWVRFTTYVDFQHNLLYVWMNGQLTFKMTQGGNLNYTGGTDLNAAQTAYLRRAHWGLYANGNFSNATVYNDAIQLWTVQQAITDPTQEPWSPYDGNGLNGGGLQVAKNNGNYAVNLQANQVSNISDAFSNSKPLGNLVINTQETAMSFSSVENSFQGNNEWSNYSDGTLVVDEQLNSNNDSNWSILNQTQANQDGVTPLSGNSVYKDWTNYQSSDSHSPYPVVQVGSSSTYFPDTTFNRYLSGTPAPVVNRFYAWADGDSSSITSSDWLSFLTLGKLTPPVPILPILPLITT